jgi:hypothetical protein
MIQGLYGHDPRGDAGIVFGGPCEIDIMRAWASTESVLSLSPEAVRLRLSIYRRVMRRANAGELGRQRTVNGRFGVFHVAATLTDGGHSVAHNRSYIVTATTKKNAHTVAMKRFVAQLLVFGFSGDNLPPFLTEVVILEEPTL